MDEYGGFQILMLGQVVVMRVSIHCQGCAAKLHKHLSRMQGTISDHSVDILVFKLLHV